MPAPIENIKCAKASVAFILGELYEIIFNAFEPASAGNEQVLTASPDGTVEVALSSQPAKVVTIQNTSGVNIRVIRASDNPDAVTNGQYWTLVPGDGKTFEAITDASDLLIAAENAGDAGLRVEYEYVGT